MDIIRLSQFSRSLTAFICCSTAVVFTEAFNELLRALTDVSAPLNHRHLSHPLRLVRIYLFSLLYNDPQMRLAYRMSSYCPRGVKAKPPDGGASMS